MHNNFYFLKQIRSVLNQKITDFRIVECYSQNKDELILAMESEEKFFYIKAALNSDFCCLSFPSEFYRSKKNSVDLFKEIIGKKISGLRQFDNERCFSILLENNLEILFKMHGNHSNLILLKEKKVIQVFKSHLKKDFDIDVAALDRSLAQTKEKFLEEGTEYAKLFPTFGKHVKKHLQDLAYENQTPDAKWGLIQKTLSEIEEEKYYIVRTEKDIFFSLLNHPDASPLDSNPLIALNQFYSFYCKEYYLKKEKFEVLKKLNSNLNKTKNYLKKTEAKLKSLAHGINYRETADVIMANLHAIPKNSELVKLFNFYSNKEESFKLKRNLSPQKNAENFYRKSKNQKLELENLQSTLDKKGEEAKKLDELILEIEASEDIKFLRKFIKKEGVNKQEEVKPYFVFTIGDYEVRVGKNAKNNDLMIQKFAHKDDLWLHAKDVAGSHVLIKKQSGKTIPNFVIEKAAEIAAYYSKRKTDSLCPVIVTPRKFIRKLKGAVAGKVIVEKEDVVLVRPQKPE